VAAEKETRDGATLYDVTLKIEGKEQEVKFDEKGAVIPDTEPRGAK
jgi:hypothetical protein